MSAILVLAVACRPASPPEATTPAPPPAETAALAAETPKAPAAAQAEPAVAPPAKLEPTKSAPTKTEPTKPAPAPTPSAKPSASPAARIEVAPTKAGLTRIGVDGCRRCHKVQYDSWLKTKHAQVDPPLDCESCHGPGSEYKALTVMKDAEKARAAGLVMPQRNFCTGACHKDKWSDDLMKRAHAHKL